MLDDNTLHRRAFLGVIGAATACAGTCSLSGCGGSNGQNTSSFSAGAASSYVAPTWKMFVSNTTIVGRDAMGFFAFSTICTHAGCMVNFNTTTDAAGDTSSDGMTVCGCHGSVFLGDGSVYRGPAQSPLPHFQVTITAGQVSVDPSTTVSPATRVVG